MAETEFPIRFEVVSAKPYIILDGAHNADKVKATVLGVKNLQARNTRTFTLLSWFL